MADSFSKKENNKKKVKKNQDKQLRREERKTNNNKGKSLDEMLVYVDVNGNFTSVPPHLQDRENDLAQAKKQKESQTATDASFQGMVTYVSEKGFGFITEQGSGESLFFHMGKLDITLNKHDKVTYTKQLTAKGYHADNIKKI